MCLNLSKKHFFSDFNKIETDIIQWIRDDDIERWNLSCHEHNAGSVKVLGLKLNQRITFSIIWNNNLFFCEMKKIRLVDTGEKGSQKRPNPNFRALRLKTVKFSYLFFLKIPLSFIRYKKKTIKIRDFTFQNSNELCYT